MDSIPRKHYLNALRNVLFVGLLCENRLYFGIIIIFVVGKSIRQDETAT